MLPTIAVALGAAALLFFVLGSWATLRLLRGLRFIEPVVQAVAAEELPQEVRALLAPGAARLVELGFVEAAAMRTTAQAVGGQPLPQHSLVFTHPMLPAVAYLAQQIGAQRERDYTIQFASRRADGSGLVTRNRMAIAGPLPLAHVVTQDCWLPSWSALWQAHQQRLQAQGSPALPWQALSGAQAVAVSAESEAQVFRTRVADADFVAAEAGSWRLSWRFALRMLARAWRHLLPSMRRMQPDAPPVVQGTQALVDAYERDMLQQRSQRWSSGAKWLLFAVTGALALASFGMAMDGGTLLALMLVLLFHELGHFVAMRWAGYQDLKVFFLPFLGAAVSGRHEQPTLRQELIVLYAGPLPGLVLGVAGLFMLEPGMPLAEWWRELATLAVVLNALNLLPVHPLDGGKVFELLLLGRWPWLAFAARLVGIAALAALALTVESAPGRIALLALALLMMLGISHLWREARVARALQRAGQWGGLGRRAALATLFERIAALGYGALPWASQRLMAGALLPGLMRPAPRAAARVGGTLLYGALLVGALVAGMVSVFVGARNAAQIVSAAASSEPVADGAEFARRWADDRNREIEALRQRAAAEPDAQRRWALLAPELMEIAPQVAAAEPGQMAAGAELLREARELAPRVDDAPAAVAAAEMALSVAATEPAQRLQHIDAALAAYDPPAAAKADPTALLHATTAWLDETTTTDVRERLMRVERSLSLAGERATANDRFPLQAARADLLLARGERDRALALLHELNTASAADLHSALQATRLVIDATWADQGAVPALKLLDEALPPLAARFADSGFAVAELMRHGMWLAEDAGRADWQRAHVRSLVEAQTQATQLPLWLRALLWVNGGGSAVNGKTLRDLEHAHWRGDAEEAQRIAAELRQRVQRFQVPLHGYHGPQRFIGPRVGERMAVLRRRLAERYQLPAREPFVPDAAAAPR